MKLELETTDLEPLVRRVVHECLQQLTSTDGAQATTAESGEKLLLNAAEAAKLLSISERTLWELKKNGDIPYVPVGSGDKKQCIRYAMDDIRELVARRKRHGNDAE